jgi:hypothetical protein
MGAASSTWSREETDPQRQAILAAADRLLAGTPRHSTGNLSVVQLAVEAQVKYWVIAQKHTDLRDLFQQLVNQTKKNPAGSGGTRDKSDTLTEKYNDLQQHCRKLEELLNLYATAINELALENQTLREQAAGGHATVTPLHGRARRTSQHHC